MYQMLGKLQIKNFVTLSQKIWKKLEHVLEIQIINRKKKKGRTLRE